MKKRVKLIPVYLLIFSLFAPCTTQAAANITHSTYTAAPQKNLYLSKTWRYYRMEI